MKYILTILLLITCSLHGRTQEYHSTGGKSDDIPITIAFNKYHNTFYLGACHHNGCFRLMYTWAFGTVTRKDDIIVLYDSMYRQELLIRMDKDTLEVIKGYDWLRQQRYVTDTSIAGNYLPLCLWDIEDRHNKVQQYDSLSMSVPVIDTSKGSNIKKAAKYKLIGTLASLVSDKVIMEISIAGNYICRRYDKIIGQGKCYQKGNDIVFYDADLHQAFFGVFTSNKKLKIVYMPMLSDREFLMVR